MYQERIRYSKVRFGRPQMLPHNADENLKALCQKVDELMPAYSRIYNAVMPLDGSLDFFGLP